MKKLFLLLWFFIGLLYLGLVNQYWTPEWDSAYFIEIARSIVTGQGYTYLGYPVLKVPFGFPLLLSPIVWLFDINFLLMNFLIVLCSLGSILATYWLFNQFFTKKYSILITVLTAFSYLMVRRSTYIQSDVPYMMFSLLALIYINRYLRYEKLYRNGILAGMLIVVSYFLRPVGISILFGTLIYLFAEKNIRFKAKKVALILLIVILPLVAWNVRNQTVKIDPKDPVWQLQEFTSYHQEYMRAEWKEHMSERITPLKMLLRITKNTMYYTGHSSGLILGQKSVLMLGLNELNTVSKPLLILMGFIALVIVAGYGMSLFSKKYFFDWYVLCYLGIIFLISARETRYLLPILPFIFHYFFTGAHWFMKKAFPITMKKYHVPVLAIFVIYFICSNLLIDIEIVKSQHRTPFYSERDQNFMNSIDWVKNNTSKESKIISVHSPVVVFLSGKWSVTFPWIEDQYMLLDFFSKVEAEYLILSPAQGNNQSYLLPLIEDNPPLFQLLYSSGEAKVYQINRSILSEKLDEMKK